LTGAQPVFNQNARFWILLISSLLLALVLALTAANAYARTEPPSVSRPLSLGPVDYLSSLRSPQDVKGKPSGFKRFVNRVIGLEDDARRMIQPHGVAIDAKGRVLIADTRGQVVHMFDAANKSYKQLRAPDSDPFLSPIAIALDQEGKIYVTDSGRSRIFVFRPDGKFSRTIGALGKKESIFKRCTGLAIDRDKGILYVVDTVAMRIVVLNEEGKLLNRIGKPGDGPGEFNYPTHIAVAPDGSLFVVDSLNFRVQHLDAAGNFISSFGHAGDGAGDFDKPKGIVVDAKNRVWVVEGRSDRVQAYDADGQMLFMFGNTGSAPGQFFLPTGIALDQEGRIYVADGQNGRVEIFRLKAEQGHAECAMPFPSRCCSRRLQDCCLPRPTTNLPSSTASMISVPAPRLQCVPQTARMPASSAIHLTMPKQAAIFGITGCHHGIFPPTAAARFNLR